MMNSKTTQRLAALVVGLLFVFSVGAVYVHSHSESTDQSCTLCQALHLPGSLTTVPAISCHVLQRAVVAPSATDWSAEAAPALAELSGPSGTHLDLLSESS